MIGQEGLFSDYPILLFAFLFHASCTRKDSLGQSVCSTVGLSQQIVLDLANKTNPVKEWTIV